jgi:copper chaperone CopZ
LRWNPWFFDPGGRRQYLPLIRLPGSHEKMNILCLQMLRISRICKKTYLIKSLSMKQLLFLLAVAALMFQACQGSGTDAGETSRSPVPAIEIAAANLDSVSFDVEGMTCTGCEDAVKRAVGTLNGIAGVEASHETGKTTVHFDRTIVDGQALKATIESAGYRVSAEGE